MPDTPADPMTELATGAAQLHELFTAYMDAGFTENQAMSLLLGVLSAGVSGGQ